MDKNYFEEIYTKYFKVLYLFSLRIVEDPSSAEDIVQDVFMECWSKRRIIDTSTSLKPFLYKLTYNKSLDFLKRSENKNTNLSLHKISFLDTLFYSTFTLDEQLHTNEIGKEINSCISLLPDRCREIFLLSRKKNLKNKELAEKLGISLKAVEKHISKALQEIRTHLLRTGYITTWLFICIGHLASVLTPINH